MSIWGSKLDSAVTSGMDRLDRAMGVSAKLITTRGGNRIAAGVFTIFGIVAALLIDDQRTGTFLFLFVTALESWTFTVIFGWASAWRQSDPTRALFWIVFAYAALATHQLTTGWLGWRYWWTDDLRQLLYLGLALTGLNLTLTMLRVLRE